MPLTLCNPPRAVAWRKRIRTDSDCLLRRSADDSHAFHAFYSAYVKRVVTFFARRTLDAETALDLTAETFALALERRAQFRGNSTQEEQGWLFAIARNQLMLYWKRGEVEREALRRVGCDPPGADAAELEWIERVADLPLLRSTVRAALGELPDDQAYAVTARVVDARAYSDLAGEIGVSEQVVRARVSRGLRTMARLLSDPSLEDVT